MYNHNTNNNTNYTNNHNNNSKNNQLLALGPGGFGSSGVRAVGASGFLLIRCRQ